MASRASPSPARPRAQTRAERQEATRQKLLDAAAQQVGAEGYAGASIQKVTASAEIANGTFYNYFGSQQDLFDRLLPELGEDLLRTIRERIRGETDGLKREELGFRTFFEFLTAHPAFYRVLNEAETFAPKAYADHMGNMASGYLRALRHASAKGELHAFSDRELEVIVYILLSARNYLAYRYTRANGKTGRLPDWVVRAYMKFVMGGLTPDGAGRRLTARDHAPPRGERYKVKASPEGRSHVTLAVSDALLDDVGSIEHGAIAGLVERAAAAACPEDAQPRVSNVSVSFVRGSHARALVARGERSGAPGPTAHVVVTVHERDAPADVVATGLVVLSLEPSAA